MVGAPLFVAIHDCCVNDKVEAEEEDKLCNHDSNVQAIGRFQAAEQFERRKIKVLITIDARQIQLGRAGNERIKEVERRCCVGEELAEVISDEATQKTCKKKG